MKKHQNRSFAPNVEQIEQRLLLSTVPQFTVKDITIPGFYVSAPKLNISGEILYRSLSSGHTFISGPNGSEPLLDIGPSNSYNGVSINDSGEVTGNIIINNTSRAFIYSNGVLKDIGSLSSTNGRSIGEAINNIGHVTGVSSNDTDNNWHVFLYDGAIHAIDAVTESLGNYIVPHDINNSDEIVGKYLVDGVTHAFYYDGTMRDLGKLPNTDESNAFSINAVGQVAGISATSFNDGWNFHEQAFVSDVNGGSLHDLGTITGFDGAIAYDINDIGEIVGAVTHDLSNSNRDRHAMLDVSGKMYDLNNLILNSPDFALNQALSINNAGQIEAQGLDSSGTLHQFLLTPVPQTPTITWSNPADIMYGTPISSTQLNATADVPGTFTYNVAEGTVLHAGAAQALTATFTPTDTNLYTTVTTTAFLNVLPAPLTVTANNVNKHFGMVVPPLTGTVTGLVNGDTDVPTYTTTATQGSWAGDYPIVPHLTDPNYNITFVNGILSIRW